mmetsp:Transcript_3100/g.4320  ORF Transcript_3100/g.4320 Transcript_3100/m.4320 type:complete len:434 (+) Transcript_3100:304-1605(+)
MNRTISNGTIATWIACPIAEKCKHFFANIFGDALLPARCRRLEAHDYSVWECSNTGLIPQGKYVLEVRHWCNADVFSLGRDHFKEISHHFPCRPRNQVINSPIEFEMLQDEKQISSWRRSSSLNTSTLFSTRRVPLSFATSPCFVEKTDPHCPRDNVPFNYEWYSNNSKLEDWPDGNTLLTQLTSALSPHTYIYFIGDSTTYYLCQTLATALSNHALKMTAAKFTEHKGPFWEFEVGKLRLLCATQTQKPINAAKRLKKLDAKAGLVILGDSAAWYARRKEQYEGPEFLLKAAKALKNKRPYIKIAWITPSRALTQAQHYVELLRDHFLPKWQQFSNSALPSGSVVAIDAYTLTNAVSEHSSDGIHYHFRYYVGNGIPIATKAGKERFGCDCYIQGGGIESQLLYRICSPVTFVILKVLMNYLLLRRGGGFYV